MHKDCEKENNAFHLVTKVLLDKFNNCQYMGTQLSISCAVRFGWSGCHICVPHPAANLIYDCMWSISRSQPYPRVFLGELRFSSRIKIDTRTVQWSYLYIIHCRIAVSRSAIYIDSFWSLVHLCYSGSSRSRTGDQQASCLAYLSALTYSILVHNIFARRILCQVNHT